MGGTSSVVYAPDPVANVTAIFPSNFFRRVIDTSDVSQLVEMNLPGCTILEGEIHENSDQTFNIHSGSGTATTRAPGSQEVTAVELRPGVTLRVRKGWWHELRADPDGMRLTTVYAPPVHPAGTVQTRQPPKM